MVAVTVAAFNLLSLSHIQNKHFASQCVCVRERAGSQRNVAFGPKDGKKYKISYINVSNGLCNILFGYKLPYAT